MQGDIGPKLLLQAKTGLSFIVVAVEPSRLADIGVYRASQTSSSFGANDQIAAAQDFYTILGSWRNLVLPRALTCNNH